jgi:hypothetical protein
MYVLNSYLASNLAQTIMFEALLASYYMYVQHI